MELINATRMVAGYTLGVEPSGRELLVVVVKGTFRIPTEAGSTLRLHEEQEALVMSDVFFGEPGLSAPKYEVDFSPRKPRCDLLLNGSAYAPGGKPTTRVAIGLRVGGWSKSFAVVGDRVWFTAGGVRASSPSAFTEMPISYDRAFGGTDQRHEDPGQHAAFMLNPSGRGFHRQLVSEWLEGSPLPNTEELGTSVTAPDGAYRPMSFGAIGRHWEPRLKYAGTYDQHWRDKEFPFLASDFDEQYYQAAPPDQQLPLPPGEQLVSLRNLTPDGTRDFVLPHRTAPICIFPKKGPPEHLTAHVDTILIEPDAERVMLTWRVARPLRRNLFEIAQVLVGKKGQEWWQRREELASPFAITEEPASSPAEHGGQ
ncbi:MAG: hypothetical protein JWO04_3379 [Gammaproteobacteria bacterium]|nr:hypothetical protein [Gammaproteobacteria bacterium]